MNDLKPNGKLDVRELNRRLHRMELWLSEVRTAEGHAQFDASKRLLAQTVRELEQPNPIKK